MKFAIIDVETTGLNPVTDRITEIGVVLIDDFEVQSVYTKLVNPGVNISSKITMITGIDQRMLENENDFEAIAEEINDLTCDCIFVGHHVQFDYAFVKNEMKRLGVTFTRKTLCTAEFTQMLHPGLRSYSLASLARHFKIINSRPHRALPDAQATSEIFLKLSGSCEEGFLENLYQARSIPVHLKNTVKELPESPGVYYFIGKNNKPIYIGKAGNIRSRVLSHFRGEGNSLKILAMASRIKAIRFAETGTEFLASLLEDHEIRHYWPELNDAQKRNIVRFGIVNYLDQLGQWRMGIAKSGKQHCFEIYFHRYHLATTFIRERVKQYQLDSFLCGIPGGEKVPSDLHNLRFIEMVENEKLNARLEVYLCKGRNEKEHGFILIEKNKYRGFGFLPADAPITKETLLENFIPRFSSITSEKLISDLRKVEEPDLLFELF